MGLAVEVIRPRHTGFCFGVRDALELTRRTVEEGGEVLALGQVVHNARALEELEARGLRQASALPENSGPSVVVTAHGAPPELFAEASRRGLRVVDTTCPLVRRVQHHAADLGQMAGTVVVVGHLEHSEVRGVVGWAASQGAEVEVVASSEEAERLPWRERRGVVSQSTFPQSRFREIAEVVAGRTGEVEVRDTTCPVVTQRQREALRSLLDQVDVVVVVGGRGSANTRALAETCSEVRPTHLVEGAAEIRKEWFSPGQRVGVTSGTSTPSWVVDEVEAVCRAL
jgi:(E)-4-hydroxy-3-methyl-but-2-enyl pyrophosphate reductase